MTEFFKTLGEGGVSALAASAFKAQPDELVEWFEDAVRADHPLLVNVIEVDSATRIETLQGLYSRLSSHPQFGGGWPLHLPPASLVPIVPQSVLGPRQRMHWFALCATSEPLAEQAQLAEQLAQLSKLPDPLEWIDELAFGGFQAALHPHLFESVGDRADHAVALFGHPLGGAAAALRSVTRSLDSAVSPYPLLADGGALEIDGPRPRARALVTAGLIERLATTAPFVLVVDEAQMASTFTVQLVQLLMRGPARGLIVLSGPPMDSGKDPRNREWLLAHGGSDLPASAARAACAIAVIATDTLVSWSQIETAAQTVSAAEATDVRDALVATGWIRPLTRDVWAFTTNEHRELLLLHALRLLGERVVRELPARVATTLPRAQFDQPLTVLVQQASAAAIDPSADLAWEYARTLASWGDLRRATVVAEGVRPTAARLAVLDAWRRSQGFPVELTHSDGDLYVSLVHGATAATPRPAAVAALRDALTWLPPTTGEPEDDTSLPLRLGVFRAFLARGDVPGARQALGDTLGRWLAHESIDAIDNLATFEGREELITRSMRVIENLNIITVLSGLAGECAALGIAYLERLELLEQTGRFDDAIDAAYLSKAACDILGRYESIAPEDFWNARLWRAWVQLRLEGDESGLDDLAELIERIRAADPTNTRRILQIEQWLARSRGLSVDASGAIDELDSLIPRIEAEFVGDTPEALDAHQWRGELLAQVGRFDESAEELRSILERRLANSSPDDEGVLVTRLRLACSLADGGNPQEALPDFDEVIRRRQLIDAPEAPRLLAALHARAICLTKLSRHEDALSDLEAVIEMRARAFPAQHPSVLTPQNDRATTLMVLQRWPEALEAVEQLLQARSESVPPDHVDILTWRQQRMLCLLAIGRMPEVMDELHDLMHLASETFGEGHTMTTALAELHAFLTNPTPAATT